MQKKTVMLAVQGEGRGHMTQAIAILEILQKSQMEVCCVLVGSGSRREIPEFFRKKFDAPIISVHSPNFAMGTDKKSIQIGKTIWQNVSQAGRFRKSLHIIHKLVGFHKPDLIINFYEPLIGLYRLFHKTDSKIISIAHQNIYLHPYFRFPSGNWFQRQALIQYTRLTAMYADRILAISIYPLPVAMDKKLTVIPPVLRKDLEGLEIRDDHFLLVYLLNSGYIQDILDWHKKHPDVRLHCFTDSKKVKDDYAGEWKVDDALTFHSLNDHKFLEMMSACSGLASTAGFESVCEAMFLGKPVLMVPVNGHFEQYCNARDAQKSGAGIHSRHFKLEKLLHYIPYHGQQNDSFRAWVNTTEEHVKTAIYS